MDEDVPNWTGCDPVFPYCPLMFCLTLLIAILIVTLKAEDVLSCGWHLALIPLMCSLSCLCCGVCLAGSYGSLRSYSE